MYPKVFWKTKCKGKARIILSNLFCSFRRGSLVLSEIEGNGTNVAIICSFDSLKPSSYMVVHLLQNYFLIFCFLRNIHYLEKKKIFIWKKKFYIDKFFYWKKLLLQRKIYTFILPKKIFLITNNIFVKTSCWTQQSGP